MPTADKSQILVELEAMKQRMDALYSESFASDENTEPVEESDALTWQPFMDIWDAESEWLVYADLPGVADEDLRVEVQDCKLIIAGRRNTSRRGVPCDPMQEERPSGHFSRAFVLPRNVRREEIKAELKRGVLTITIPKGLVAEGAPQRISIVSES